jgi:hypothetical protein
LLTAAVCVGAGLGGCALPPTAPSADTGLSITMRQPVPIPGGSAHAIFQHGRVVCAASLFEPFCELEVSTVAPARRPLAPGRFRVTRIGHRLLRDPITRIPAVRTGFDCEDGIFQESLWRLAPADAGASPDVRRLRCIAPYHQCRFGPPLSVDQVQLVVGPYLAVGVITR